MNKETITVGEVKGMNVLSLYDGMSCGMLAMLKAGIKVDNYYAYEIDKYAIKTSQHNFPKIKQCGDVFKGDYTQYEGIDYLIGGSPCTYWSIAQSPDKRETTASGIGWELFSQYVRALHEAKPKFFIYENNKSMSKAIRESITQTFGFEPICINSALVSAQNRQRIYWVGKRNADGTYSKVDVEQPKDRGILLRDVLDGYEPVCIASRGRYSDTDSRTNKTDAPTYQHYEARTDGKTNTITTVSKDNLVGEPVRVGIYPTSDGRLLDSQGMRVYSVDAKSVTQSAQGGGMGAKTGLYAVPILPIKEATKKGYTEIQLGNCFDYEQPNSKTRRGRKMDEKSNCLTTSCNFYQYIAYAVEFDENSKPTKAVSSADGKTYTVYEVKDGNITIKGKTYPIKFVDGYYIIRKLTVSECKRLQTVPEWYEFPVSNTRAYSMLGNGWTVDVIAHLIEATKIGKTAEKIEQLSLF